MCGSNQSEVFHKRKRVICHAGLAIYCSLIAFSKIVCFFVVYSIILGGVLDRYLVLIKSSLFDFFFLFRFCVYCLIFGKTIKFN